MNRTALAIIVLTASFCCDATQPYPTTVDSDDFISSPINGGFMLAKIVAGPPKSFDPVYFMTQNATEIRKLSVGNPRIVMFCGTSSTQTVGTASCSGSSLVATATLPNTLVVVEAPGSGFTVAPTGWVLLSQSQVWGGLSGVNGIISGVVNGSGSTATVVGAIVIILFIILLIVGLCVCRKRFSKGEAAIQQPERRRQLPQLPVTSYRNQSIAYAPVPRPGTTSATTTTVSDTRSSDVEMRPVIAPVIPSVRTYEMPTTVVSSDRVVLPQPPPQSTSLFAELNPNTTAPVTMTTNESGREGIANLDLLGY